VFAGLLRVFAGLLREHEEVFASHRSVRSAMKPVMNAQQCVDSQLIVEAPALMSIVHPYSISLRTTARWPSEVSQADPLLGGPSR
jgi:hypothetical protein